MLLMLCSTYSFPLLFRYTGSWEVSLPLSAPLDCGDQGCGPDKSICFNGVPHTCQLISMLGHFRKAAVRPVLPLTKDFWPW